MATVAFLFFFRLPELFINTSERIRLSFFVFLHFLVVGSVHWCRSLLGWAGRGPLLGDVNFFFLYIAIMTGENLQ